VHRNRWLEIRMALKLLRRRMADDVVGASVTYWHVACGSPMQHRTKERPAGRRFLPDSGVTNTNRVGKGGG